MLPTSKCRQKPQLCRRKRIKGYRHLLTGDQKGTRPPGKHELEAVDLCSPQISLQLGKKLLFPQPKLNHQPKHSHMDSTKV